MARPLLRNPIPTADNLLIVQKLLVEYQWWLPGARNPPDRAERDEPRHRVVAQRAPQSGAGRATAAIVATAAAAAAAEELTLARQFLTEVEGAVVVLDRAIEHGTHQQDRQFRIATQYLKRVFPFKN